MGAGWEQRAHPRAQVLPSAGPPSDRRSSGASARRRPVCQLEIRDAQRGELPGNVVTAQLRLAHCAEDAAIAGPRLGPAEPVPHPIAGDGRSSTTRRSATSSVKHTQRTRSSTVRVTRRSPCHGRAGTGAGDGYRAIPRRRASTRKRRDPRSRSDRRRRVSRSEAPLLLVGAATKRSTALHLVESQRPRQIGSLSAYRDAWWVFGAGRPAPIAAS